VVRVRAAVAVKGFGARGWRLGYGAEVRERVELGWGSGGARMGWDLKGCEHDLEPL
jgi:hypothetical protein